MHIQTHLPLPTQTCLFELSNLVYLQIQGEKAASFLQGQLTCDLNEISPVNMHPGALCNLKGRVLALMDVINWNGAYGLVMPENLVNMVQKELKLVGQLSRVQFKISSDFQCYGLFVPQAELNHFSFTLPQKQYELVNTIKFACYSLAENMFMILTHPSAIQEICPAPMQNSLAWHMLLLSKGCPSIYPETSGKFLPHELLPIQTTHVSFNKGCYKGQEIIARMHFKGVNKYRLHLKIIQHEKPLLPGMAIYDATKPIGEIIDLAELSPQNYLVLGNVLQTHEQSFLDGTINFNSSGPNDTYLS
jgi:tRNA-modifying protein YgfZ